MTYYYLLIGYESGLLRCPNENKRNNGGEENGLGLNPEATKLSPLIKQYKIPEVRP